jgi:hypothetical protein
VILNGVGISWPTIHGTNYTVQWTGSLATNAGWNSLAPAIAGDGTTKTVFDPIGINPGRFYRVFKSP